MYLHGKKDLGGRGLFNLISLGVSCLSVFENPTKAQLLKGIQVQEHICHFYLSFILCRALPMKCAQRLPQSTSKRSGPTNLTRVQALNSSVASGLRWLCTCAQTEMQSPRKSRCLLYKVQLSRGFEDLNFRLRHLNLFVNLAVSVWHCDFWLVRSSKILFIFPSNRKLLCRAVTSKFN